METQLTTCETELFERLENAHAELIAARKIAALNKHESYEEIGDAIECIEAAFIWIKTC